MSEQHSRLRIERRVFSAPADTLAQSLLGCKLVRRLPDGTRLAGIIVETEAYLGVVDKAAHSYNNRRTARTEPMFGPGGTAYVYFTYGMHHCMNVAASTEGDPQAVLIRALEPTEGSRTMRAIRAKTSKAANPNALPEHLLCSGPARLCQAMDIDRRFSGTDLTASDELWIEERTRSRGSDEPDIGRSVRIGIGYAEEWVQTPLRYFLRGSRSLSGPKALSVSGPALD